MSGFRHGWHKTRTYRLWSSIKRRCGKSGTMPSRYYRDKGVTMAERWESFEDFLADVGEIPEGMTLDRVDSGRGYEPGNVRWATPQEQSRNKSNNRSITIAGTTKLLCEWSEESGLPVNTIRNRIEAGWPEGEVLLPANAKRHVLLTVGDRTMPLTAWAEEAGVRVELVSKRLKRGWSPERAVSRGGAMLAAGPQGKARVPRKKAKPKDRRTYQIWSSMLTRCRIVMSQSHAARGIRVCERWQDFGNFFEDVGVIPPGYSLDRIDNDGDYEPGNVRLATTKEQARNRGNNRYLTINGVTKLLIEWAEENELSTTAIRERIKFGWPEDQWLAPSGSLNNRLLTVGDETRRISEWAKLTGIKKDTIYARIKRGWPAERCLDPP